MNIIQKHNYFMSGIFRNKITSSQDFQGWASTLCPSGSEMNLSCRGPEALERALCGRASWRRPLASWEVLAGVTGSRSWVFPGSGPLRANFGTSSPGGREKIFSPSKTGGPPKTSQPSQDVAEPGAPRACQGLRAHRQNFDYRV